MNNLLQRRWPLALILAAYLVIATIYSVVVPLFEASDETWHYPMVKYLADNGLALPVQDPANVGPWRQEGSQPPLYYMLAALLTSGIDTSDMDMVRRVNPHAGLGVIRPDGNANAVVHRVDLESFPWRGTVLAVHVVRFFSVLLGAGTVLVTYLLGREIFPEYPLVAYSAAALNAFLPMFVFISAVVNNDNLSNLLGNLLTLLIVRLLKTSSLPHWRTYATLGVVTGAGLLSKLNIGFLIPLVALALVAVSIRLRDWRPLVLGGGLSGALTIAIAGWWYWRNWQLYGDPTGLNVFLELVGRRQVPANLAQLWSERYSFMYSYWGFFGGLNILMPEYIYTTFNVVGGGALVSAAVFFARVLWRRLWPVYRWLPIAVTIIWPIVTFVSLLRWTTDTPASQGRLVFGALSSISLWMAFGLLWWLPKRIQPWITTGMAGSLATISLLVPFFVIAPEYKLPDEIPPGQPLITFYEPDNSGAIGMLDVEILTPTVQPGQYAHLQADWQVMQPLDRDWSLFVHLVTPERVIAAQRDVYPGAGKLATSDLPAGRTWSNPLAVWVPQTAYAPMTLDVYIGWYHLPTGERLVLPSGATGLLIGQIELQAREDDLGVPNPMRVNFDHQIELVGYSLSSLVARAGDRIELTLYWRALRDVERDYVVFAHILDPNSQAIYAASDAMPVQWNAPTSTWEPGVIVEDRHTLDINPDTPSGIYELEVGLYLQEPDGTFPRLRIVTEDGGMSNNFIYLSRVGVLPAQPGNTDAQSPE